MSIISASPIDRELAVGERHLWKGRPKSGIRLRSSDAYQIPFSLLWGGFAFVWEYMAVAHVPTDTPMGLLFPLFGIPFVLIGIYIIIGRFFVEAKNREKTEYAVTNQRAIIVSGFFSRRVKSINLRSMPEITITEKSDNSGTISFGPTMQPYGSWAAGSWFPGMNWQPASSFEMIDNVRSVYQIMLKARDG